MKFSYSKLNTFLTCPQKYYLKYNLKIPEIENQEMQIGGALHEAIHCMLKNTTVNPALDDFIARTAQKVIEYLKFKYVIIGSEVFFEIPFEDVEFQGFIDIVAKDKNNKLYVLDFKLGTGNLLQTKIYARMLEKAKNRLVDFVGLLKISLNDDPVVSEYIRPFDNREDVDKFLQQTISDIKSEQNFSPKPGTQCLACAYVELCPLKTFILEKRLESLSLQQKLDLLNYVDAFKDVLQKQLKDVLQTTDRIESENAVAFLEETTYKRLTVKKLPDEVYTTLFDAYGFDAFELKKELVEEHFPNLFKTISQKRLKITTKEG